jgi:hypothetical protein
MDFDAYQQETYQHVSALVSRYLEELLTSWTTNGEAATSADGTVALRGSGGEYTIIIWLPVTPSGRAQCTSRNSKPMKSPST